MGNGRLLFGRTSGFGRKTYRCQACGHTARWGLFDIGGAAMAVFMGMVATGPKCPCGAGRMVKYEPPKKDKGRGKNKPRHEEQR